MGKRANDFEVQYYWEEGALPPPNHYQMAITIGPGDTGTYELCPNYPNFHPPTWTQSFPVAEKKLSQLFDVMLELGILTDSVTTSDGQGVDAVGGELEWVRVTNRGHQHHTLSGSENSARLKSVREAVSRLVPDLYKSKLDASLAQYRNERQHLLGSIVTTNETTKADPYHREVQPFTFNWWTEALDVGDHKKGWDLQKTQPDLTDEERTAISRDIQRLSPVPVEAIRLGEYWCSRERHWVTAVGGEWSVGVCMSCSMDMGNELMDYYKDKE